MKKTINICLSILVSLQITAQENPKKCMTTSIVKKELENNPEYQIMKLNLTNYQKENTETNYKTKATITIPVVIHIVHRAQDNIGNNTNISNAQIEDQLIILNEDYSKTNLKFCLATTDPSGNSTNGITRTSTTKSSFDADTESNDMKQNITSGKDSWDPLRYMNIWVCNLSNSSGGGQTLGYAYLPGLQNSSQSWKDGLVVDYKFFGTIENASSSSDGRTPTHEIGHYLGLSHTFCESGGCCDNDNSSWGLPVYDTPATDGIYWGNVNSSTSNNTCDDLNYGFSSDLLDMDENYMSYAGDTWMFSNGQAVAMNDVLSAPTWQGGRLELKNSTVTINCTGIIPSSDESWECDGQGNCTDPGNGNGQYTSLTNCNSACNSTYIEDINKNLFLYPNPTTGNIFINTSEKVISISVYNIIGKRVIFTEIFTSNTIDISSLEIGVYFFNIRTNNGIHVEKIILSK
ncbi:MAG: zinc-dependent metalloprotease [Flavobacteriales bacterium]